MHSESHQVTADDGHVIHLHYWYKKTKKPRPLIHISHGMAEHASRYSPFAERALQAGFNVFAHSHRGHGQNTDDQPLGHYADSNGWEKVVNDMNTVQRYAAQHFAPTELFLFGHSMGSFISLAYVARYQPELSGLLLSGSNYENPLKLKLLVPFIKAEQLRVGPRRPSALLNYLSFGSFNNAFKPCRTENDWLSRDPQMVDEYINDDLCGFECTTQLWADLVGGLIELYSEETLKNIPAELPVFLFAGDKDPVGRFGAGVRHLAEQLIATKHNDVAIRLYPEGRHEMLNETNREEVMDDALGWLQSRLKSAT